MNKTYSLDGVQAILSYPFKQQGWQSKFAIGAALFFANYIVPIIPSIFMAGYFAKIMQASIEDGAEPVLPEWDNWGELFSRGFKVTCASIVYLLPALVLMIGGYVLMEAPVIMLSISSSASRYSSMSNNMVGLIMICVFAGMAMFFLGMMLYLPMLLVLPLAITHAIAKNSFVAAFHIRAWWSIFRANVWGFFAALAVISGVYLILFMAVYMLYFTVILCFLMPIGMGIIVVYLSTVGAPMLGEAYRKGVDNLVATAAVSA